MSFAVSTGRLAGLVYLGVVVTGVFTLAYAPGRLIVDGDAAATLAEFAGNETLVRTDIGAGFAMLAFFLALPLVLFRLLARRGRALALLMVLFVAASMPASIVAMQSKLAIAELVFGAGGEAVDLQDAVATHLAAYDRGMSIASIFWGLWLAPLGLLILKSGAIPRALGVLLLLGCAGYLANYFGPLVFAGYDELPYRDLVSKPGSIGEMGTCLWLLIMGAREGPPAKTL